jgi:putative intracellular protease/amidase
MQKILMVLTSHDDLGGLRKTGFYAPEAAHPATIFEARGYTLEFVSPRGGAAPMDGFKPDDPEQAAFHERYRDQLQNTLTPDQINPSDYAAIFYVGGHGTMWDFPTDTRLSSLAGRIYDNGGVVAAVCHGPAGLVNIRLENGAFLVDGKTLAAFTNAEEAAVGLTNTVPFLLETKLVERGAKHVSAPNFQENVQTSERLVTGQNPASARGVANAVVRLLQAKPVNAA